LKTTEKKFLSQHHWFEKAMSSADKLLAFSLKELLLTEYFEMVLVTEHRKLSFVATENNKSTVSSLR